MGVPLRVDNDGMASQPFVGVKRKGAESELPAVCGGTPAEQTHSQVSSGATWRDLAEFADRDALSLALQPSSHTNTAPGSIAGRRVRAAKASVPAKLWRASGGGHPCRFHAPIWVGQGGEAGHGERPASGEANNKY